MNSIRLSLMVCFLGLLAVALLAASLLVYRNAEQTLAAKQQAMAQLIQTQYEDSCRKEELRLDEDLLSQAQSLAQLVQVQFERNQTDLVQPLFLLGTLSSNGCVLAPVWLAAGMPPQFGRSEHPLHQDVRHQLRWRLRPSAKLKLDQLMLPGDGQVGKYFQIDSDSPPTKSFYSLSMDGRSFPPPDTSAFHPDQVFHWVYDNVKLEPGVPLRRVVLKASGVGRVNTLPGPRPGLRSGPRPGRESRSPPPRPPGEPAGPPPVYRGPTIYIHCAAETRKRDADIAGLGQQADEELAKVAEETNDSLHDLRLRLLAISLIVFAATGVGGFWLVRLGLSPLRRLSDAVSRVSAKDFRLPLGERPLPLELRPIAERLSSTLDLLKRAFAREKQAAADISHELRTPLAALLTTTEFGLRKPRSPEHYRELLSDCHASAQQMNQIVERLLTLARLDAGVDRLRPQAVDVASLARQCATVIRPLAEARGLKLTFESPDSPAPAAGGDGACQVQIDPDKLREIVTNLLHNAIQYNRPGGSIDLRVGRANGTLEVEVRDTGIGISPEAREHIFERFYRADPSRHCDELHAGLGLAIVKEYIDLMGGSIGVESTEGRGSTFRILLPVR